MTFKARATDDLVRVGAAGGGVRMEGKARATDDLIRIAAATRTGGGTLVLVGMSARATDDLIRIAAAGRGHVLFED